MNQPTPKPKSAVVIGAGIAGLTAAYHLGKHGWAVTVIERNTYPGGRMGNLQRGRMLLETGATEIFSFYQDMLELIKEVGLTDQLVSADMYSTFHIKDGQREYDFDYSKSPSALLTTPALSTASKLRLPALVPDLLRFKASVDPCLLESAADFDDRDTASYLTDKVGRDFVDGFIAPLFRVFWRWQPEAFSRAYFLTFIAHTLGSRIFTFREGVGTLTRTLASRMDVRYGRSATGILQMPDGSCRVSYADKDGTAAVVQADAVVVATEAYRVPGLIPELPVADRQFFESVRYTQSMAAHYLLKREVVPCSVIYTVNDPSPVLSYAQVPSGCPGFPGVPSRLWVSLTPEYLASHVNSGGSNLDEITRPHVRQLYPSLDEDLLEAHMQYEGLQLVLVYPGYIKAQRQFLERRAASDGPHFFCGDYLAHPHTGGACASGKRVAEQVIQRYS
jgi:protoporphyrinogen/coproporphyrinogen III oxidase